MSSCWELCEKVLNPILSCCGLRAKVPNLVMTEEKFRNWLNNEVIKDDPGEIGWQELSRALQNLGITNCDSKAQSAMKKADLDKNGCIRKGEEVDALINYAVKHWGITLAKA